MTAAPFDGVRFLRVVPILRIFDEAKAKEFYAGFLGSQIDWEHRFELSLPLYMQVTRAGMSLHLSGHHGDGTPGGITFVEMTGLRDFHAEISAKGYPDPQIKHRVRALARPCHGDHRPLLQPPPLLRARRRIGPSKTLRVRFIRAPPGRA